MKIRLITFHTPKNYGAVLQAYSLMSVLEQKCDDVKIIDFNTAHLRSIYPVIPRLSGIKGFASCILNSYTYFPKYKKYKKFENFVTEKLNLTERYECIEELYQYAWEKDTVFICGSDQVFNPNRRGDEVKAFYMDFVPETNFKFSYAASFGVLEIPEDKTETIKKYLKKFDNISVRENSGEEIVKAVADKNVVSVLDPTLLNDKFFWEKCEKKYKKNFEHYLLYYRLLGSRESDMIAMKKAKEENLKLVVVTEKNARGIKNAEVLRDVGPQELLRLYNKSDFVISDSFHGIAFSIIYNKPFIFSDLNPKLNPRGLNLIKMLEIKEENTFGKDASGDVDYEAVDSKLKTLRSNSINFINNSLKQAKGREL